MSSRPESANEPLSSAETLPRVLNRFDAITVVVGSIIGSGIFLKASTVATELQSFGPIMLIWIVVGLVTLCGALALAELAAMLPQAGGPYVYLREAYGRLPAFLWGWTEFWIIRTGSLGALACATVIYGNELLVAAKSADWLPAFFADHIPLTHNAQGMVSLLLIIICSVINVIGTRWAAWVQNVTSVIKVAFILFLIVAPFVLLKAKTDNLQPIWPADWSLAFFRSMGIAMIAVFWPYDGWINIGPVAEEIKEPQRNVPFALAAGVLLVIAVYLGANASYHLVLPMQDVANSTAVATDVTRSLLGTHWLWLAALGVTFSTFGALNSNLLAGPRIYFAMARDGLLPAAISHVHPRFKTPANAVIAQMAWSLVLVIGAYWWTAPDPPVPGPEPVTSPMVAADAQPVGMIAQWLRKAFIPKSGPREAFDALTNFVIFGGSIFYAMAVGAVFILRWTRPELPRPYRTWGYPITPAFYLLVFAAALVSLLLDALPQTIAGSLLIVAGVVVYFIVVGRESAMKGGDK
ncbi:Serine/threonine exchanger SteT [Anatilimnocola aggregata]|uniref:Serine/threonine exchanger SteT n=1 Tax=Anatilimnocola aggregata TaxID=2528021 RepID=A0A517YC71_9BACT|nr:amino acid permease [Anatilimnocola aggregata]QDU27843.1 Serine/threonine exchanger SteT [Anatilimnocola aggregata]